MLEISEISIVMAVILAYFSIHANHLLSRARDINTQARSILRDYNLNQRRLKARIARRLAAESSPENVLIYLMGMVRRYYELEDTAHEVRGFVGDNEVIRTAKTYLFAGLLMLLYVAVVGVLTANARTVIIMAILVASMLIMIGQNSEQSLNKYQELVDELDETLQYLRSELNV